MTFYPVFMRVCLVYAGDVADAAVRALEIRSPRATRTTCPAMTSRLGRSRRGMGARAAPDSYLVSRRLTAESIRGERIRTDLGWRPRPYDAGIRSCWRRRRPRGARARRSACLACITAAHRLSLHSCALQPVSSSWLWSGSHPGRCEATDSRGRRYESQTGRFRVLLPAPPLATSGVFKTRAGSVPEVGVETETADLVLKVEHHDLPRLACLLLPDQRILEFATSGLLDDRHGRLESEQRTFFQGHPGRTLRYARTDLGDRPEEARLVLVGQRLYIAVARADGASDAREQIARFFDSFEFWED